MGEWKFEVYMGEDSAHYWRLRDANGETVAVGGEGYTDRNDCVEALDRVRIGAVDARLVVL